MERLSIILPCFNEEGNIERTVREVETWMRGRGIEGEIIVVDDGSRDRTGEILARMQNCPSPQPSPAGRGRIRVVTHPTNLGYGTAVRSGCDAARTEWIGFMDADGQFDPRDFDRLLAFVCHPAVRGPEGLPLGPELVAEGSGPEREVRAACMVRGSAPGLAPHHDKLRATKDGASVYYDVVVGRRRKRADPFLRKVNAKLFGVLSWVVLGIWVRDVNCAMKVFRRSVWERARPVVTTGALFNAEFFYNLKWQGIPWKQVDVAHYPRRAGKQTGARFSVIVRTLRELWALKRSS